MPHFRIYHHRPGPRKYLHIRWTDERDGMRWHSVWWWRLYIEYYL